MPPVFARQRKHSSDAPLCSAPLALDSLLQRCGAESDHDAFAVLYDEMAAKVYGLAYRVLRNSAHAEEVAQEAFLDVWLNANRYDRTRGTAESWILTIARRRAVDRVRHVSAAERRDDAHAETEPVSLPDSTADLAVALEEARLVREALGRLPGAQRQAIELAYLGGQTHREIAVLLGIPVGTGKTRIRDGLRRLRLELQASGIRAEPMTATTAQTPVRSPA